MCYYFKPTIFDLEEVQDSWWGKTKLKKKIDRQEVLAQTYGQNDQDH